jgi:hypothetical protein
MGGEVCGVHIPITIYLYRPEPCYINYNFTNLLLIARSFHAPFDNGSKRNCARKG